MTTSSSRADKRSLLCTLILVPLVVVLLVLSWFRGGIPNQQNEPSSPEDSVHPTEHVVAGYFVDWAIYDRGYGVADLAKESDKLSHVLYAFANLMDDGTIVLGDDWADKDKHFTEDETFNHQPDSWNDIGTNLYGNLKQLYLLKQRNRNLKVSLSVGGWSWSNNFTTVAKDPAKRARFAESALQHVQDYGLDGLDVDWEHPKDDEEAQAYVDLLHDLREKLTDRYLISVAVSSGAEVYRKMHLKDMAQHLDFFYIMAYDLAGAWDPVIGHQAALYGTLSVKSAIDDYLVAGVPAQKIIMGIPAYGRAFSKVKSAKPGSSFKGVPEGSWEEGSFDYKDLPRPGATEHIDEEAMASYSYDPKKQEFVTYDNPYIVEKKCDLVRELGLGGVMFWELSADNHGSEDRSLLYAASRAFGGNIDTTRNHLDYPKSRFDNIRNKMQS